MTETFYSGVFVPPEDKEEIVESGMVVEEGTSEEQEASIDFASLPLNKALESLVPSYEQVKQKREIYSGVYEDVNRRVEEYRQSLLALKADQITEAHKACKEEEGKADKETGKRVSAFTDAAAQGVYGPGKAVFMKNRILRAISLAEDRDITDIDVINDWNLLVGADEVQGESLQLGSRGKSFVEGPTSEITNPEAQALFDRLLSRYRLSFLYSVFTEAGFTIELLPGKKISMGSCGSSSGSIYAIGIVLSKDRIAIVTEEDGGGGDKIWGIADLRFNPSLSAKRGRVDNANELSTLTDQELEVVRSHFSDAEVMSNEEE